jgi:hypothetical protein
MCEGKGKNDGLGGGRDGVLGRAGWGADSAMIKYASERMIQIGITGYAEK